MRAAALAAAVALMLAAVPARADAPASSSASAPATAPRDAGAAMRDANRALAAGDWARAEAMVLAIDSRQLAAADRAEVHRILGLAAFFLGRHADAERELVAYLRLDLDARLDPSVTPPEAVTFFEDVRARHAAELRALRPVGRRRWVGASFLPPFGQFQNGDRTKGWLIAGTGLALLGANVGSYLVLRSWCDEDNFTCGSHTAGARRMRVVNLATGAGLAAVYVYGVIDGLIGYRATTRSPRFEVAPTQGGAALLVRGHF